MTTWEAITKRSLAEIDDAVADTREFIATRPAEAEAWLLAHAAPGLVAKPAAPGPAPAAALRALGRPRLVKGALHTPLAAPGPGLLIQRATMATANGRATACVRRREVNRARSLTLRCKLTESARERRRLAPLRLKVETRFRADDGSADRLTHRITLPRA